MATKKAGKYTPTNLIPMFRLAAKLRKEMLAAGFTDNGGAIHSAERILNLLGISLIYPDLSHGNNLRHHKDALFSLKARAAHDLKTKVMIEHVSPIRDLTRKAIEQIDGGASDEKLESLVKANYVLVLLTPEETLHLNGQNRSKMTDPPLDRLRLAGIEPWASAPRARI
jgi:hypothetical protein